MACSCLPVDYFIYWIRLGYTESWRKEGGGSTPGRFLGLVAGGVGTVYNEKGPEDAGNGRRLLP